MLSTLAFAGFIVSTMGHGRLTKPMTRVGNTGYENDPIGFGGRPARQYICRHDAPNPAVTPEIVNAGEELTVQWVTTAAHVGDCSLYLSYDGDKALEDMRWFKIANKQDCKEFSRQDVKFDLPSWLPGGNAVLRWEWAALHVYPTIEFYAQCADIVVNPSEDEVSIIGVPTFKIFENGQKTSLPLSGNDGVGFRNAFSSNSQLWSPSNPSQFMTGPECVDESLNECSLTSRGTAGHVDLETTTGGGVIPPAQDPTTQPPPIPTQAPVESPTSPPVESPTYKPTSPPVAAPTQPPVSSPTQPPVAPPTMPPVTGDCSGGLIGMYQQCDGQGFTRPANPDGCPLCPAGFQCYRASKWYSNCNHSCPQGLGWDCENDAAPAPVTGPPSAQPSTGSEDESGCPNGEYDTCGGSDPTAPHCCQEGLTCTALSQWHSQCMKSN